MTPYAITGVGLVSPLGVGYPAFVRALAEWVRAPSDLFAGASALFDPKSVADSMAAECRDFDAKQHLGDKGLRNFDRLTKMLIVSGKLTLEDAGLKRDGVHVLQPDRIGLCSATAYGSLEAITEAVQITELEDPRFLNPNRFPNTVINASAGYVSIWEDLRAPNVTVVNGNCGSLDAVFNGAMHVMHGRADAFLVGGGEALSEPLYAAFRRLGVLAEAGRRFAPGRPDSQGTRIGEGSAYVCIEQRAFAAQRGARVHGEIIGYGNAFEPPESEAVVVHASSLAVERAIRTALQDAQLTPAEIDVVASAQSGIVDFDSAEFKGIRAVLGADVAVATPKAIYGETWGAAGALSMACALAWFAGVPIAPLVNGAVRDTPRHVLVLALGYYGNASAVVMRRHAYIAPQIRSGFPTRCTS